MRHSDILIRLTAFGLSAGFHLLLLALAWPNMKVHFKSQPKEYYIPIKMQMTQEKPQRETPQRKTREPQNAHPKNEVIQKERPPFPKKTIALKETPSPTRLAGDRDFPELKEAPAVVYPKYAINYNWKGKIVVDVTVDAFGKAVSYNVVESTGYTLLDEAFTRTVSEWYQFEPKRILGKNVSGQIRVSYVFE